MAKVMSGFPWMISGKLGDRVYFTRNGKNYSRKLPVRKKRDPETPLQPIQLKFSLVTKFLKPLVPLFRKSFGSRNISMSGFNKAVSLNIKNAITGEYPNYSIDYNQITLGNGCLAPPGLVSAYPNEKGKLIFFWRTSRGKGVVKTKDNIYIAIFSESLNKWFFVIEEAAAIRGLFLIDVPAFSGYSVHIYMGFISEFGRDASPSAYGGLVEVL